MSRISRGYKQIYSTVLAEVWVRSTAEPRQPAEVITAWLRAAMPSRSTSIKVSEVTAEPCNQLDATIRNPGATELPELDALARGLDQIHPEVSELSR